MNLVNFKYLVVDESIKELEFLLLFFTFFTDAIVCEVLFNYVCIYNYNNGICLVYECINT